MRWYCAICWRMRKAMKGSINGTIISSNRYPCALSRINLGSQLCRRALKKKFNVRTK